MLFPSYRCSFLRKDHRIPLFQRLVLYASFACIAGPSNSLEAQVPGDASNPPDTTAPTIVDIVPHSEATVFELNQIEIIFNENIAGVDSADLLVNGVGATNVTVVSPRDYVFYFTQPAAGVVTFSFATKHGIADLATPANAFAGKGWTLTLSATRPLPKVIISEIMADNTSGIKDDTAERSDWIELLNLETEAVNLEGWFLTDEPNHLAKWRFPALPLAPNAYLLVWASGKNHLDPTVPLHTSFKLAKEGAYLALVDPATNIISAFRPGYPPQQSNISFGRDKADPSLAGFFVSPTPGTTNTISGPGFAPNPAFSISGGVFTNASVTVSVTAASGEIHYTLDGTVPTLTSPTFTQALVLTNNAVLSARVFQDPLLPSQILIETYTLLGLGTLDFSSNLPLLVINTAGKTIPQDRRIRATVSSFEVKDGRARLRNQPDFKSTSQIEVRGQTSAGFPKLPYNLEIDDPTGNDVEVPLFGLPPESDWVLINPYSDKAIMNNALTFELHRKMGHYAPRTLYVEVFIKSTGGRLTYPADYKGLYILTEKIKIDRSRVDTDRLTPYDAAEPKITGGYIVKKDKDSPGDVNFSTTSGQSLKYHEPKPREITVAQKTWIRNYLNQFEKNLYASDWLTRTGTNHYSYYIDQDSFVDYHWIVEFSKQIDGYRLSNYMSKDRGGKLKMEPIWDWNLAWGNADYLEGQFTNGWYYSLINDNEHIWLRRMVSATGKSGDPDFNQKVVDRWSMLRTNILNSTNVVERVKEISSYLSEAADRDFKKWPRLGTYIWPNPPIYARPKTYAEIITNMNNWIYGRYRWIDRQFPVTPVLSHPGGRVPEGSTLSIFAPTGTVYYTFDGTDPRMARGAISAAAKPYNGTPLVLNSNARIVARSLEGTNRWSAPVVGTFAVKASPLSVTEIMFHAPPPPAGNTNSAEAFSFIELRNVSTSPLNLLGYRITQGIQYTFSSDSSVTALAPGGYVVIVKNRTAFASRYPNVANVAGQFTGSFDNGGERIVIEGPLQETVADFKYQDQWHPTTDGLGFSLILANESALPDNPSAAASWRPSARLDGSPGQADPPPPVFPRVVINEVLTDGLAAQPDAIELFNPGSVPADISGWFLTDDRTAPKKYRLPDRTILPANGYLALDEKTFNPANGGFSFNRTGEEVFLFSGANGSLTGYGHGFDFGPAASGVTFGRYVTSTGAEHFVAPRQATLGGTNAGPLVGPLVISEIMFEPRPIGSTNNTLAEFIELRNISAQIVRLADTSAPTNTWRLKGGADFHFPTNIMIAPNGFAVIVNFNPATEPNTLANFRAAYGIDSTVALYGPYKGNLANDGERVGLYKPTTPTSTSVPYILVDEVAYSNAAPWPANAAGTGNSLQRRFDDQYGNDPLNWQAAFPSPGRASLVTDIDADGDGLPDDWEKQNFGNLLAGPFDDADRDGLSNKDEFIAGTDPRDASSYLRVESLHVNGGSARLSFKAVAGKAYSVLYRDDLVNGSWTKLADVPARTVTAEAQVTDPAGRLVRFYRLVTPQAP